MLPPLSGLVERDRERAGETETWRERETEGGDACGGAGSREMETDAEREKDGERQYTGKRVMQRKIRDRYTERRKYRKRPPKN